MTAVAAALGLLGLMLAWARSAERQLEERIEADMDAALCGEPRALLAALMLPVRGHRLGLELCALARARADVGRLGRGVRVVEASAPGVLESLRAVRDVARTVGAIVPIPAPRPSAWRAWPLRGLAVAAAAVHAGLVSGAERVPVRVWLLARALVLGVRWLGVAARGERPAWARVERAAADLGVVGDQAEDTLARVVRAAAAARALTEASRPRDASAWP